MGCILSRNHDFLGRRVVVTSIKIDILDKKIDLVRKKDIWDIRLLLLFVLKKAAPKNRRTLFQIIKLSIFH